MATASLQLLDSLFTTHEMRAIFSDRSRVQRMLDFEAALARAEAKIGIIPDLAATAIAKKCDADLFDFDGLGNAAAQAGNLAIPLVKQLTASVARDSAEAARFVHWGATSQDAIDTGSVLQLRDALNAIERQLGELSNALVVQVKRHRNTLMVGRTWLQHALPITFGLKAAGWLAAITRDRQRLKEIQPRVLALQFGGAAGTLASLGTQGIAVATELARELKLALPARPWHSERDGVVEVATTLGLLVGSLGKIARDISLCMQTDVGELAEPAAAGRGGSSTMPHKRNPVGCATALSAAIRVPGLVSTLLSAMPQEHERGLGGWQAEWNTLPEIAMLAAGALDRMTGVIAGLEVDAQRMSVNLALGNGLVMAEAVAMALGKSIAKPEAHRVMEQACLKAVRESCHLRDVLAEDPVVRVHLTGSELEKLMDPVNYLGATQEIIDRVLSAAGADGK